MHLKLLAKSFNSIVLVSIYSSTFQLLLMPFNPKTPKCRKMKYLVVIQRYFLIFHVCTFSIYFSFLGKKENISERYYRKRCLSVYREELLLSKYLKHIVVYYFAKLKSTKYRNIIRSC